MKNLFLKLITLSFFLSFVFFGGTQICLGQQGLDSETAKKQGEQAEAFLNSSGYQGKATVGDIVATTVKAVLSLLAIIFLVIIIINGYKWMMAGGNEDQVKEAKQSIKNATIGLIIVLAAYSITHFVFEALSQVGDSGGSNNLGGGSP